MMQDLGIKVPKLLTEIINTTGRIYEPSTDGSTVYFDVAPRRCTPRSRTPRR